jgi:undecaprenyl-diphosphatase
MSVPIMLAAGGYETYGLFKDGVDFGSFLPLITVGFVTAGIVGWLSIKWLLGYLGKHSLYSFAIYCAALGAVCVALQYIVVK